MLPENNIRKFVLRVFLCTFGLLFVFSILTSKASLQTQTTAVNVNAATVKPPTPRPTTRKNNSNLSSNISSDYRESNAVMPVATPTPPANSTVRGRVFYADTGRAVKRASIMLMDDSPENGPATSPTGMTDGDGYFEVKNVRAGTYYALVNAPGVVSPLAFFDFSTAQNRASEKDGLQKAFLNFEKIVVDGISAIDVQVAARRGGAIGGRITYDDGDAAIGVKVEIFRKEEDKFLTVIPNLSTIFSMRTGGVFQTDDRGVYRFSGLPAGEYIVKVTEMATHTDIGIKTYYNPVDSIFGATSFLTFFYPDASDSKSAQVINVAAGQEITEINLTIPSRNLYKVEGKIVAAKDKTPVKARITISKEGDDNTFSVFSDSERRQQIGLTDENGNWKFKELPKGTYKILVEPIDSENTYQGYLGNYSYANMNTNVERNVPPKPKYTRKSQEIIIEDKDVSELVVELGYGATISGTAAVENTQEMPKMMTVYSTSEADRLNVSASISNYYDENLPRQANINREFILENVVAGKNRLYVQIPEDGFYVKSIRAGAVDLLNGFVELKEGEILRNVQIILSKEVGTLKGLVSDDNKAPVSIELSFVPTDTSRRRNSNFYRSVKSDRNGEFQTKLAPGEYAVVIFDARAIAKNPDDFYKWLDEAVKDAQKVKIEAGRTEIVSIKKSK